MVSSDTASTTRYASTPAALRGDQVGFAPTLAIALLTVGTAGCAMFRTPEISFKEAGTSASSTYTGVGAIPRSFAPATKAYGYRAASPFPNTKEDRSQWWRMEFESLTNGRICFKKVEWSFQDQGTGGSKDTLTDYAVEAHTTLDIPTRPIFPEVLTGRFDSYEFVGKNHGRTETGAKEIDGDKIVDQTVGMWFYEERFCGPAPKITPETQFITVSRRGLAPYPSNPGTIPTVLLVWKISDAAPDADPPAASAPP